MKAASSAYTFLTVNPTHEVMKENLRFYINDLKVDPNYIINMEAKPYVDFYIRGSEAYKKKDYDRSSNYFELSLIEYLTSEEECRAECEGPFDQGINSQYFHHKLVFKNPFSFIGWFPDFISSISSMTKLFFYL